MVFIHGGGYFMGSSATPIYDGAALARKGCVYVSVNYRLGALGCLDLSSLSNDDITFDDNLFLRDLVMALRWVRDNIAVFGGDPDNVTIFGESAGAHAVATLLAVPAAKGLFAQAISESPAAGMVRISGYRGRVRNEVRRAARRPQGGRRPRRDGGPPGRAGQRVRPVDRGRASARCSARLRRARPAARDYLPLDPVEAMRDGKAHRVPLIVGTNAEEARLFGRFLKLLPMTEPMIERLLAGTEPAERERITAAYPGYPDPAACIQFGGDFAFGSAAWQIAEAHSRHAPTYLYRYDYAPRTLRWSGLGATHATELLAVFDVYRTTFGKLLTAAADRSSALRVSDDVQSRWRAFARTGVPGDDWPAYTSPDRAVRVFDRRPRVEYDPHASRRAGLGRLLAGRPLNASLRTRGAIEPACRKSLRIPPRMWLRDSRGLPPGSARQRRVHGGRVDPATSSTVSVLRRTPLTSCDASRTGRTRRAPVHTTDVVERPADLTAEWLTAAIGAPIERFTFERIGTGQMSECYRVALTYAADGARAARSVVLKVAATDPMSRQTGLALGLYEREVRFYTDIAPGLDGPVAPATTPASTPTPAPSTCCSATPLRLSWATKSAAPQSNRPCWR